MLCLIKSLPFFRGITSIRPRCIFSYKDERNGISSSLSIVILNSSPGCKILLFGIFSFPISTVCRNTSLFINFTVSPIFIFIFIG